CTACNGTLTGGQVVNQADTSTAVSSNHNPSVFGQSVTFTASVSVDSPGAGTPGGTVQFKIDGVDFGAAVALVGGSASSGATSSLAVGNRVVTAVYGGSTNFNGSNGTLTGGQVVRSEERRVGEGSKSQPSRYGQRVTCKATVSVACPGAGAVGGSVLFKIDGVDFGAAVALVGGSASSGATSSLAVGNRVVTAVYGGSTNFNGSNGTLTGGQVV